MIIATTDPADADGLTAELYADDLASDGVVFAHTRALAVNPEAYAAFEAVLRAVVPSIGLRVYEIATLGAALGIGSVHCLLAHGRKTLDAGLLDAAALVRLVGGDALGVLSPAEAAVFAYAYRLSTDAASMTDRDARALREAGFDDRQIVDITLAAAARNHLSRTLQALAVPVDEIPRLDAELAHALRTAALGRGERA